MFSTLYTKLHHILACHILADKLSGKILFHSVKAESQFNLLSSPYEHFYTTSLYIEVYQRASHYINRFGYRP